MGPTFPHQAVSHTKPTPWTPNAEWSYTNLGDGVGFFNADNEVIACSWRAKNAIGLPVSIAPQADLNQPITVTPDQAGIWYGMSNCAWRLTPADGSAPSEWNPGSKALTSIELRAGDRFATTCAMRAGSLYHFPVIPDGLFPLEGALAPGLRRPATPATAGSSPSTSQPTGPRSRSSTCKRRSHHRHPVRTRQTLPGDAQSHAPGRAHPPAALLGPAHAR